MKTGPFDESPTIVAEDIPPFNIEEFPGNPSAPDESDVEEAAMAAETRAEGHRFIREHLGQHLTQNPNSSYITWVATLHPENATVTIDPRFLIPGNPWMILYEQALYQQHTVATPITSTTNNNNNDDDVGGNTPPMVTGVPVDQHQDHQPKDKTAVDYMGGHAGLFDLVVGMALQLAAIAGTIVIEIGCLSCFVLGIMSFNTAKYFGKKNNSNCITFLPRLVANLLFVVLRLVDASLLLASILLVEALAASAWLLCSILACSTKVGSMCHQKIRRLAHLARWACRRPFNGFELSRENFSCFIRSSDSQESTSNNQVSATTNDNDDDDDNSKKDKRYSVTLN
mmetsp:Transcript_538/g.760  ORF Transcript_538/g.760 Transcript_538/m.760 type:complete len:341 (-) Transcript_538:224-1246(-)|eukprot:CAMPEP_0118702510 /NCGR_PEP_ID=MMETSP0800-20121206/17935_1 /TAXON_ID=210618 ORGANISM="Striatella unipunctata, Strain CCMP2910" /NCGR_SAMPLE_ID=MMETSP0800 /ASSEMBLY_ACC=CAM_ASM_000638 /LENGTH=340 /DNA_ID=CAMNT_0006603727 /DNA_START=8 /DNA_END=1030 /DNA_ORIENTATION=-